MPVYSTHRSYDTAVSQWTRCRDAHAGTDAVKRAGVAYLPLLESANQSKILNPAYQTYKDRALFYPAMGRTVQSLAGIVFGKPPTTTGVPKSEQPEFDDVTLTGVSIGSFGLAVTQEVLVVGRTGILVDMPAAEEANPNPRPYWVIYTAESIVNWRVQRIQGEMKLTRVVLKENYETPSAEDEFVPNVIIQYRVLSLVNGMYTADIWREDNSKKGDWVKIDSHIPRRRGQPLNYIPFVFVNANGIEPTVDNPPLLDLVDVNYSHYRTSADQEHGAHFTALPTPYIIGHEIPPNTSLAIGSGTAWVLPEPQAKCGMLEFSGAGLAALASLKEEKRQLMITLGARMLETQKNTQEAAATVAMRHAGERSALSVLADSVSQGLTKAIRWHLAWRGITQSIVDKVQVQLNPDIMEQLSPNDLNALVAAWQAGAISHKTVYYNMQWGEWTRPDTTFEQELQDIEDEDTDVDDDDGLDLPTPPAPRVGNA